MDARDKPGHDDSSGPEHVLGSALYVGSVVHRRVRPRPHRLRYRIFWFLLDLDEVDILDRRLRLFSKDRFNAVSFHDKDHGDGGGAPLRTQIQKRLADAGVATDGGAIRLLCMPRIFGYGFNPLSVYFCHRRSGDLAALIYEVHNTFGERRSYLIEVEPGDDRAIRQTCRKDFYVSPFMDMDMSYAFRVTVPGEHVSVLIRGSDAEGEIIAAALGGKRVELSDRALLGLLFSHPLETLKVIAAIHWHAVLLFLKGVRPRRRPAAPDRAVTVVAPVRPQ